MMMTSKIISRSPHWAQMACWIFQAPGNFVSTRLWLTSDAEGDNPKQNYPIKPSLGVPLPVATLFRAEVMSADSRLST